MKLSLLRRSSRARVSAVVLSATNLSPLVRRLVLGGAELTDWLGSVETRAPAAWIKVFPPGREGRAYTIRRVDDEAATLTVDFVMHGQGPDCGSVADWARFAQPGDAIQIAGPRVGGFALMPDTNWVWIAADASALPAAQSILESLPAGLSAAALLAVEDEYEHQPVRSAARVLIQWRHGLQPPHALPADDSMLEHMAGLKAPGQVWIAGEVEWMKSWRRYWLDELGLDRLRLSGKGYWKQGERDYRG